MQRTLIPLLGAAVLLLSGQAIAAADFATYDANGDGQITQAEFDAARSDEMAAQAARGQLPQDIDPNQTFGALDKNQDGVLSKDEFLRSLAPDSTSTRTSRADSNQPQALVQQQPETATGRSARDLDSDIGRGFPPVNFSALDSDGDGVITALEYDVARSEAMERQSKQGKLLKGQDIPFSSLDKNGDGQVDTLEFQQFQAQRQTTR